MERKTRNKFMYGGLVTAMVLIAVTGTTYLTQSTRSGGGSARVAELNKASFQVAENKSNKDLSSIAGNVSSSIGRTRSQNDSKKESYRLSIEESNTRRTEQAIRQSESAIPMSVSPPKGALSLQFAEADLEAPAAKIAKVKPAPSDDAVSIGNFPQEVGRDQFEDFDVNPFKLVDADPVSTFSVDVDTASYSFVRRQLNNGVLPQKDAVRIEEMINYFDYDYPLPETREQPFKPTVTVMDSPWAEGKKLMHIGIKGFDIEAERPKSNLVFLLDVSGSMNQPNKLPLLISSLKMLVDNLDEDDMVSIVVYAGAAGAVLEPTKATDKSAIYSALNSLKAGGSTAGAAGINLAYQLAEQNFDENAVNRVILATDGDFNVGITDRDELKDFVERKRESGVFLSVFGFGQGNYNDHLMQTLAQNGNGVAAYIDTLSEARKILVDEATSSLFPIAKDVKIQVEFNPKAVAEYRLVGYETRALKREDFNNDKVDAGDIGAGHKVTAIYEITPVGSDARSVDPLRYGDKNETKKEEETKADFDSEYAFVKMRYKLPKESKSKLITTSVTKQNDIGSIQNIIDDGDLDKLTNDIAFSVSVAGFAQLLKGGKHTGDLSYEDIIKMSNKTKGDDPFGYRAEFVQLVRMAKTAKDM